MVKMGKKEVLLECEPWGPWGRRRARGGAAGGCPSTHLQLSHTHRRGPGREAHRAAAAPGEPGRPHSSGLARPRCPPPHDPCLPPRRPMAVPPWGPRNRGRSPSPSMLPVPPGPHCRPSLGTPLGTAAIPLGVLQVPRGPHISSRPPLSLHACCLSPCGPVAVPPRDPVSPGDLCLSPHACCLSPRGPHSCPFPGPYISQGIPH